MDYIAHPTLISKPSHLFNSPVLRRHYGDDKATIASDDAPSLNHTPASIKYVAASSATKLLTSTLSPPVYLRCHEGGEADIKSNLLKYIASAKLIAENNCPDDVL